MYARLVNSLNMIGHANACSHLWEFTTWRFICRGLTIVSQLLCKFHVKGGIVFVGFKILRGGTRNSGWEARRSTEINRRESWVTGQGGWQKWYQSTEPKDEAENQEPELSRSRAMVNCWATRISWEAVDGLTSQNHKERGQSQDGQGQGPQWWKEQSELTWDRQGFWHGLRLLTT